jgi:hypothetical protein
MNTFTCTNCNKKGEWTWEWKWKLAFNNESNWYNTTQPNIEEEWRPILVFCSFSCQKQWEKDDGRNSTGKNG